MKKIVLKYHKLYIKIVFKLLNNQVIVYHKRIELNIIKNINTLNINYYLINY